MDSKTGQQFLNYAYSWGASIVILGALFKLTHIAGANMMLFIGMGTEVIVFFLAGFEHQYANEGDITDAEDKRLAVAAKQLMTVKKQKREVRLSLVAVALVVEPLSSVETVVVLQLAVAQLSLVAVDLPTQAMLLLVVVQQKALWQQLRVKHLWMQQLWQKVFLISPYLSITA